MRSPPALACVLAAVLHVCTGRTCPRPNAGGETFESGQHEYQVVPAWQAQDCLDRLSISAKNAYHTIMHLEHGVTEVYSYTQLANGPESSVQELADGCRLPIHNSDVDLLGELKKIKIDLLAKAGLRKFVDFDALLDSNIEISAARFHGRLESLFRRLNDAHTVYFSPVQDVVPVYFLGGSMEKKLRFALAPGQILQVFKSGNWLLPGEWVDVKAVVVDGKSKMSPMNWLLQMVDAKMGQYKSRGARLNKLLQHLATGIWHFAPLGQSFEFVPARGRTPIKAEAQAMLINKDLDGDDGVNMMINKNPRWEAVRGWLDASLNLNGTARSASVAQALKMARAAAPLAPTAAALIEAMGHLTEGNGTSDGDADPFDGVADDVEDGPLESGAHDAGAAPVVGRRLLPRGVRLIGSVGGQGRKDPEAPIIGYKLDKAVVLKIKTFSKSRLSEMLAPLIALYRDLTRAAWRHDRLILDLSDNGGGLVEAANIFTYLIAPRLDTPEKLCSHYRVAMHSFWRKWIRSFGGQWERLENEADTLSAVEIRNRIERLWDTFELEAAIKVPAPIRKSILKPLYDDRHRLTDRDLRRRWRELLANKDDLLLPGPDDRFKSVVGKDASDGWYPLDANVKDPSTARYFDPPTKPFQRPDTKQWGKGKAMYSQPYLMSCSTVFDSEFNAEWGLDQAKFQWREIAVVTNGLCGSTCSLIATKLQFAEGATVFTYGGVPGDELMDSSAFAGGSVYEWKDFWPQTLYAAVIGDILHGPRTEIGRLMREPGAKKRHWAKSLLLPLPHSAKVGFNYDMMHTTELGPDALPREWYTIPAHKHYDVWHFDETPQGREGRLDLYKQIQAEDWARLRKQGVEGHPEVSFRCAAEPPKHTKRRSQPKEWRVAGSLDYESEDFWERDDDDRDAAGLLVLARLLSCACYCGCLGGVVGLLYIVYKRQHQPQPVLSPPMVEMSSQQVNAQI